MIFQSFAAVLVSSALSITKNIKYAKFLGEKMKKTLVNLCSTHSQWARKFEKVQVKKTREIN